MVFTVVKLYRSVNSKMTKLCFGNLENMFLTLITCLIFGVANCQVPSDTPAYSSLFFKNIGIKLCQIKCVKNGHCRAIEYTIATLTCQLLEMDHDTLANEELYFVGTTELADVRACSCQLKTCPNMTCLETRTGKTACVKEKEHQTQMYSDTDLLDACEKGDLSRVKSILSDPGANINSMTKGKMTAVMFAAVEGHREVFDLLVRKGANLSLLDTTDASILHLACEGGNIEIVKYVLTQNIVAINSRDEEGTTPIMHAASNGDKGVFDVLVEAGADLSLLNNIEDDILHLACEGENVEIIKYLLTRGNVDINRKQDGCTPVMKTALASNKEVFDLFVKEGADLSLLSDDKNNVLHLACFGGNVEIVKSLLTKNIVDINSQDAYRRTPAMIAAHRGHKAVFDLLVNNGADLRIVNDVGDNILNMACVGGNFEIVKYVIAQNIVDINSQDAYGRTPAMIAEYSGHKALLGILIQKGANHKFVSKVKPILKSPIYC